MNLSNHITDRLIVVMTTAVLFCLVCPCASATAGTIISSIREVDAQTLRIETDSDRSELLEIGTFNANVNAGTSRRFASAQQTSTITETTSGALIIVGAGTATSERTDDIGASENTLAKSALSVEMSLSEIAIILLRGHLSSPPEIELTADWLYDRSFSRITLRDQTSAKTLWSSNEDGTVLFSQQVPAGTYELEIESVAEIKNFLRYEKTVGWDVTFEVRNVPEASGLWLARCVACILLCSRSRLAAT